MIGLFAIGAGAIACGAHLAWAVIDGVRAPAFQVEQLDLQPDGDYWRAKAEQRGSGALQALVVWLHEQQPDDGVYRATGAGDKATVAYGRGWGYAAL